MTWQDWIDKHAAMFGFGLAGEGKAGTQEMDMLAEWTHLFHKDGHTPQDAYEASQRLALGSPPKYRSEHLNALLASLRNGKRPPRGDQPEAPAARACELCDDSGLACGLPSRHCVLRGRRGYETVCCQCARGQQRRVALSELRPPHLSEYEYDLPDWRAILARWREQDRALANATAAAAGLDKLLGRIIARARAQGKAT